MRVVLVFITTCIMLFGADLYVESQTYLLDKAGGKEIGVLHVGARLTLIKDSDEYAQVEYVGFIPEGGTTAYARLGILEHDFDTTDDKVMTAIDKVKDDYDNEWLKVSVKGFVKKDALTNNIAKIYASGENLFKERCGGCHALHGYDEFGINVWPSVVETMISQSALEPNEFQSIVRFLQSKAPIE